MLKNYFLLTSLISEHKVKIDLESVYFNLSSV